MGFSYTQIQETTEELRALMSKTTSAHSFQKIQALYLLKKREIQTVTSLAKRLGVNRITIHRWLNKYKKGGMALLLNKNYANGRTRKIPPDALQELIEKLNRTHSGFKTYCDVQTWLEEKYGINVSYKVVYSTIRYQLNLPIRGNIR